MYIEHVVLFISGNVNSLHKQLYGLFIRIVFQGIFDPQRTQQAEPHHAVSGGNAVQIVHAAVEGLQRLAHLLENTSPNCVSSKLRPFFSNSDTPSSCSSCTMAWLRLGCDILTAADSKELFP
ncbi:MAG: hypothetical protein UIJ86_07835 [Oscillospiraceae bacterium]|nr:hypothetical protein [Oscillospiraceae bacterium]